MSDKLKVHQLSQPDYDNLKENLQRIHDCLVKEQMQELQAKAALLALSIMFKVELDSLLAMWNVTALNSCKWVSKHIETDEVHTEMAKQFAEYMAIHYEMNVLSDYLNDPDINN